MMKNLQVEEICNELKYWSNIYKVKSIYVIYVTMCNIVYVIYVSVQCNNNIQRVIEGYRYPYLKFN